MKRRGWAIAIVSGLVIISIIILSVRSDSWATVASGGGGGAWEENVIYSGNGNERIVQIFMEGPIAESDGFFSTYAVSDLISQLDQARDDDSILGVVIRVNSPGGSVVLSDEIHNKIMDLKELNKKVVVSMGEVAASGGYYIAAPADYIFAKRNGLPSHGISSERQ
jgi:protease-4